MLYTLNDLRRKEIIDTKTGVILGRADDIQFDPDTAEVISMLIYGRPKFFGFLGRDGDLAVKFENVTLIGKDAILVTSAEQLLPEKDPQESKSAKI